MGMHVRFWPMTYLPFSNSIQITDESDLNTLQRNLCSDLNQFVSLGCQHEDHILLSKRQIAVHQNQIASRFVFWKIFGLILFRTLSIASLAMHKILTVYSSEFPQVCFIR